MRLTRFAATVAAESVALAAAEGRAADRVADRAVLDPRADAAEDPASLKSAAREIVDTKFIAHTI